MSKRNILVKINVLYYLVSNIKIISFNEAIQKAKDFNLKKIYKVATFNGAKRKIALSMNIPTIKGIRRK